MHIIDVLVDTRAERSILSKRWAPQIGMDHDNKLTICLKGVFHSARIDGCIMIVSQEYICDILLAYTDEYLLTRIEVGDLMYKLDNTTKIWVITKLRLVYVGPYFVTRAISPILYEIERRRSIDVIHHDILKICRDRNVPLWMCSDRTMLSICMGHSGGDMYSICHSPQ